MEELVDQLKEELSYLITTSSEGERRRGKQEKISRINLLINHQVSEMVERAGLTIKNRTAEVTAEINKTFIFLASTIVATFILAFFIARYLTISLTKPIDNLVTAAREVADGNWGYQSGFKARDEFAVLFNTFNNMSRSLEEKGQLLREQFEKLKSTQKQLAEAEKFAAIGTLAGGIAHDFNNILCGITGHVSLIKEKLPDSGQVLSSLNTVEAATIRAADLVRQLLTFSRQKVVEPLTININDCVNSVVELLKNTFDKKITIDTDLASPSLLTYGDPGKIEQVVMNLCINARDAMPDGGVIRIKTKSIHLDRQFAMQPDNAGVGEGKYVLLTVADNGSGIEESIRSRIFEPFFTTKDIGKGTGLGLAMVYGIVKGHGGHCTVDSNPGQGTTFNIYLPQTRPAAINPARPPSQLGITPGSTILVIDDEEMIVSMLEDHFRNHGCTTISATNGEEGVAAFQKHHGQIDLVILDLNMPIMDGYETFDKLIAIRPDIKIIIFSGYSEGDKAQMLITRGARGFIQKPFQLKDFDDKVSQVMHQQPETG